MIGARRGLGFIATGFAVDAFAALASSLLGLGAQTFAFPVMWLVASGLVTVGLAQLALTERASGFIWAAAALVMLNALLDFATLALLRTDDVAFISSPLMSLVSNAGLFISLFERAAVAWVLFTIANQRNAWAVIFTVVTFGAVLVRTAYSAVLAWGLVATDGISTTLMIAATFVSAVSAFGLAMVARANVEEASPSRSPPTPERASPTTDFLVGGGILLIGVVVTTVSVSSASNGGRYIVATGAIAVGLARIVRGVVGLTGK